MLISNFTNDKQFSNESLTFLLYEHLNAVFIKPYRIIIVSP